MPTEIQHYVRAILLEEFDNESNGEKALEKLQAELGPNAITKAAAVGRYNYFKDRFKRIADSEDVADRYLIENGTFLRSKRSFLCEFSDFEHPYMPQTYGIDARFRIVCEFGPQTIWMLDTFNEIAKEIRINTKQPRMHDFKLEIIYFIGSSTVCGVFDHICDGRRFWFKGNFNVTNLVLQIGTIKFINDFNDYILDTQTQPPTLTGVLGNNFCSYTVDLDNGNLSEVNIINMQHNLWSPIIRNGKLYGFPYFRYWSKNTNKLWEVSLVDGSTIEHKVEDECNMGIRNVLRPFLWIDDKLLVGVYDWNNKVSTVMKFDISKMKWEKTKIEVEGRIESMNVSDGILIVLAFNRKYHLNQFYSFQYKAVDSLANLVWLSMRRYSKRNVYFYNWFLSKLPNNHKLRSL